MMTLAMMRKTIILSMAAVELAVRLSMTLSTPCHGKTTIMNTVTGLAADVTQRIMIGIAAMIDHSNASRFCFQAT